MTEKELHRLRRQDLLQLLLAQGKEAAQLQSSLDEAEEQLGELQETKERFIGRMDDKDAQIEKLKKKLDEKDVQIEKFKGRLDEKDAQIARLKGRLDEKDLKIQGLEAKLDDYLTRRRSEFDQAESIAEIGARLGNIFALAQKAVDRKLEAVPEGQDGGTEESLSIIKVEEAGNQGNIYEKETH